MRQPMVAPCAALAVGIAVARFSSLSFAETPFSGILLAALAAVALWFRAHRAGRLACLCAVALVGAQRASFPPEPIDQRVDQVFRSAGIDREVPVRLRGWVREPPEHFDDSDRVVVEVTSLYRGEPTWGGLRLTVNRYPGYPPLDLDYGDEIEVLGRVRELRNFNNPGAFDRVGFLAKQEIFIGAIVRPRVPIRVLGNERVSSITAFVWNAREEVRERFDSLWGGKIAESVLRAILIGDASSLDRETTIDFQRTGAYHALVISGLHIGLLAFTLLALLRMVGAPTLVRAVLAMTLVAVYVALIGARLPVSRAAIMLAAFLIASLIFRQRQALNVVAAIACGFLLLDPTLIADAGFQMSFVAVAAIAAIGVPLLERTVEPYRRAAIDIDNVDRDIHVDVRVAELRVGLRNWLEPLKALLPLPVWLTTSLVCGSLRLLSWIVALGVMSLVIQLAIALPLAYHFQRVSFSGVFANLALMPLLTIVIPCGLFALASGWTLPASVAALGATLITNWTHAMADSLHLDMRVPPPPAWLGVLLVGALAVWVWSLQTPKRNSLGGALAVICLVAAVCVHPFSPSIEAGRMELTAIDVGQGESLFVAFPNGGTMLMDGGGRPDYGRGESDDDNDNDARTIDIGDAVVSPYLWSRSIQRLDVVAVSHPDADHVAGVPAILENFDVGELWLGAGTFADDYAPLVAKARERGVNVEWVSQGDMRSFGGADVTVLAPAATSPPGIERNNLSMVLALHFGEHDFLLTGDIEEDAEESIASSLVHQPIDVLKVAHHGSRGATSEVFLSNADPVFAMISAGFDNTYRHPHTELIERLDEGGTAILRTDLHGAVTVISDGHRLTVERFLDQGAGSRGR